MLAAIPDAAIPAGECGMILWTLDEQAPRPVFRHIIGKGATAALDGEPSQFDLVDSGGLSRFGISERQVFRRADGLSANVRVEFGLGFDGGSYLERGIITIESAGGWRAVTPTAGLVGCRRKL